MTGSSAHLHARRYLAGFTCCSTRDHREYGEAVEQLLSLALLDNDADPHRRVAVHRAQLLPGLHRLITEHCIYFHALRGRGHSACRHMLRETQAGSRIRQRLAVARRGHRATDVAVRHKCVHANETPARKRTARTRCAPVCWGLWCRASRDRMASLCQCTVRTASPFQGKRRTVE